MLPAVPGGDLVATADTPTGPFIYHGSFRPNVKSWPIHITEDQKKEKSGRLAPSARWRAT